MIKIFFFNLQDLQIFSFLLNLAQVHWKYDRNKLNAFFWKWKSFPNPCSGVTKVSQDMFVHFSFWLISSLWKWFLSTLFLQLFTKGSSMINTHSHWVRLGKLPAGIVRFLRSLIVSNDSLRFTECFLSQNLICLTSLWFLTKETLWIG